MTVSYALKLKISLIRNRQSDALGVVEGQPLGATDTNAALGWIDDRR
jgi:hypothetical protein